MLAEQLLAALEPPPFELPPAVLEWIALVERESGADKADLSRLLFSLEAFIERVSPELRREADKGESGWWPAVHEAEGLISAGRKLGLTDIKTEPPSYRGRFLPKLFTELLRRIRSLADHPSLKHVADRALELAPA
jgi:hypothetical protein